MDTTPRLTVCGAGAAGLAIAVDNPPTHVALTIPIAGFVFYRHKGGKFYQDATVPGARLVDAFDAERERLSRHLGSDLFESQFDFDKRSNLYDDRDIREAGRPSPHATGSRQPPTWSRCAARRASILPKYSNSS